MKVNHMQANRIRERKARMQKNGKFGKAKGFPPGLDHCTEIGLPIKTCWGTAEQKAAKARKKADEDALFLLYNMVMSKEHTTEELIRVYDLIVEEKYDQLPIKLGSKMTVRSEKYVPPQKKLMQTHIKDQSQPQTHSYPQKRNNTIKIFDVPCYYGKEDIAAHLSGCGPIESIKILSNDREDSNNTIIVSFRLPFGVQRALDTVDKKPWGGSVVSIKVLS